MGTYRILSVDGGGVRGVISIRLLQRLVRAKPDLIHRADLFAGTSTGAIIAACLAHGMTCDEIFNLYYTRSKNIFSRNWLRRLGFQALAAKYDNKHIQQVLTDTFGSTKLSDVRGKFLVSSLDMDSYDGNGNRSFKPKFFHNLEGQDADELLLSVVDVLMYSAAAPTYFPSHEGYIDGGIVANNPSVAAIAQALDPKTLPSPLLGDIRVLSVGTGKMSSYIPGQKNDWGFLRWSTTLVELILNGSVDVADYECRQLLKGNYVRVNPCLDKEFKLDSVKYIDRMVESADSYDISRHVEWVNKHF